MREANACEELHKHPIRGLSDPAVGLSEIAVTRREQILDAAEAIIAGHGIQHLSLGRIEERAGMSRGQLTYYFPTKESILLAVHDRMLRRMISEFQSEDGPKPQTGRAGECFRFALERHLAPAWPTPPAQSLLSILFTFLAQTGHREEYRKRLAQWYAEWRSFIAADVAGSVPEPRFAPPRVAAALVQALIHGLDVQLMMDPEAFDRTEMLGAVTKLFAPLFAPVPDSPTPGAPGSEG
ncbi:TetR/AcrR family transcriptional regulator [Gemmata obscuriglobus]|uniref:TetR/AcrR family transcriptional regulator n=1 Tax=Gemmata obscuriglobus TaxID=114 RepID=UPI0013899168|nr:TetR/AcrR family transcriptional regulator [Gemmata obscuriglobus]